MSVHPHPRQRRPRISKKLWRKILLQYSNLKNVWVIYHRLPNRLERIFLLFNPILHSVHHILNLHHSTIQHREYNIPILPYNLRRSPPNQFTTPPQQYSRTQYCMKPPSLPLKLSSHGAPSLVDATLRLV